MKKIILFVFVLCVGLSLFAQDSNTQKPAPTSRKAEKRQRINSIIKQEEEGNLSFRKQTAFGIQLRTNGYGGFIELGRRKSPRFSNLYALEITEIKHRKEDKIGGAENFFSNSYVLGKINNFYTAKLGYGQQYILGQKGNKNGVAITASLQGGIDIGLMKPYFIDIQDASGTDRSVSYYTDSTAFKNPQIIYGASGFTKGWSNLKIKPGLYVKTALRFDFGRYNETLQAMEIGMSVEAFSGEVPILLYNEAKQLFYQGHVAFVFGSRK